MKMRFMFSLHKHCQRIGQHKVNVNKNVFLLFVIRYHLTLLFENDRHFSHLSNLEKEMAFRTEMVNRIEYIKLSLWIMAFHPF